MKKFALLLAMVLAFYHVPAQAQDNTPRIEQAAALLPNDGYGAWIVIDGIRPIGVNHADSVRYRTWTGMVMPDEWLAMTLRWTTVKAIRLKIGHLLYAQLVPLPSVPVSTTPLPVPNPGSTTGTVIPDPRIKIIDTRFPGLLDKLAN